MTLPFQSSGEVGNKYFEIHVMGAMAVLSLAQALEIAVSVTEAAHLVDC
ncbi:hypothetical protein ACVWXP_007357 [Bradyrhizobium sp. USDA 4463]